MPPDKSNKELPPFGERFVPDTTRLQDLPDAPAPPPPGYSVVNKKLDKVIKVLENCDQRGAEIAKQQAEQAAASSSSEPAPEPNMRGAHHLVGPKSRLAFQTTPRPTGPGKTVGGSSTSDAPSKAAGKAAAKRSAEQQASDAHPFSSLQAHLAARNATSSGLDWVPEVPRPKRACTDETLIKIERDAKIDNNTHLHADGSVSGSAVNSIMPTRTHTDQPPSPKSPPKRKRVDGKGSPTEPIECLSDAEEEEGGEEEPEIKVKSEGSSSGAEAEVQEVPDPTEYRIHPGLCFGLTYWQFVQHTGNEERARFLWEHAPLGKTPDDSD